MKTKGVRAEVKEHCRRTGGLLCLFQQISFFFSIQVVQRQSGREVVEDDGSGRPSSRSPFTGPAATHCYWLSRVLVTSAMDSRGLPGDLSEDTRTSLLGVDGGCGRGGSTVHGAAIPRPRPPRQRPPRPHRPRRRSRRTGRP